MKQIWFKRKGWLYLPVHPAGFMVTALAVLFMIPIIIANDRNVHSVTDELYSNFIYGSCTAFWWKWVADKTSLPS
ncbi:MAG: hypothetical protein JWQ27_983 [Ferruginibacter sp.]|nr:hypothetical protein [Ferruginibacter sp.]